jgi:glucose dehydrogenase
MLVSPPDGEWLMWRRNYGHWGFSPLDQIDRENVAGLRLAWAWTMERGLQDTTPLVHDGVMFLPQACDFVEAVDARDGTLLWTYRRERVEHAATNNACMRYTPLPVEPTLGGYHSSADYRRIAVPGGGSDVCQLTAIDVATGETLWQLSQRAGIGGSVLTTGGGLVFVTDDARRFRAFDAETGEVLWEQILNASAGDFPVSYEVDGVQYIAIAAGGGVN